MPFASRSLDSTPHAGKVRNILAAALAAADPSDAIQAALARHIRWSNEAHRVFLLAVGKAGMRMAEAALPLLDSKLADGLIVTKHASRVTLGRIPVLEADHPIPGARSLAAGQRVLNLISGLHPGDLLVCLFSGGASALMTALIDGLSLADLQALTATMLSSGARIDELNVLRRRLDRLKGGGVARLAAPARVLSLILSDVVGDRLDIIASGPTVPDPASQEEIESILLRYSLEARLPAFILNSLRSVERIANSLYNVKNILVGSNAISLRAARRQALRAGFCARVLNAHLQGEARDVGRALAQTLRRSRTRPLCLLAGGETTVTVTGDGRGGRNQELALAAALELDGAPDVMVISFATDGDDGITGASGAVVTGDTLKRARSLGLDAQDFLRRNDSHTFFAALDDLLVTGPTGTNVNDLMLMFRF
jgi:hydroxypyruvate reductase